MKPNVSKYKIVDVLPKNAMTVKQYAESRNPKITTSYIYKLLKEKKANFEIVVFQTINFIIPKK